MIARTWRSAAAVGLLAITAAASGCGQATDPLLAAGAQPVSGLLADAGADIMASSGQTVALDGSQSADPEGDPLTFSWAQTGGEMIVDPEGPLDRPTLYFTAPLVASRVVLEFTLSVSDGVEQAADVVQVTVLETDAPAAGAQTADAGPDFPASEPCGALHPTVEFEADAWSGPAPLEVTLQAVNTGGAPLPEDTELTWMIDEEGESGPMSTHARLKRIFRSPGMHTVGLCLAAGGVSWGCLSAQERELRRQLTVWPVITGRVVSAGQGVAGVIVSASNVSGGATAVTGGDGAFRLAVPYGWSGAVTPDHEAYSFEPPRMVLSTVRTQILNLTFSAENKVLAQDPAAGDDAADAEPDAVAFDLVDCTTDAQCADGSFCNGGERCVAGRCAPGPAACAGQLCDEAQDMCATVECSAHLDCDDGLFCNGAERCSGRQCTAGADPCPNRTCSESLRRCTDCQSDADCHDGLFCNGSESCVAGVCLSDGAPCAAGSSCDEAARQCFECLTDADCDDGVFCNGTETCQTHTCRDGQAPCAAAQVCDEPAQRCQQAGQRVAGLTLIDAGRDVALAGHDPMTDGSVVPGASLPALNIRANTAPQTVGSVRFELRRNGAVIRQHVENSPPYALFGNNGNDYFPWPDGGPAAGSTYQIKATPYAAAGAGGAPGTPLELSFSIALSGCSSGADCDDGVFCNGVEACQSGNCAAGDPPCSPGQSCDEPAETCTGACSSAGACNDRMFCNGIETCTPGGCVSSGSPCPTGQYCIEASDICRSGSWTPPLGIPAPDFGIEEAAAPYDPANSLHYHVDKSHSAATNTDNPRGSPAKPRASIPMDLPAGALVEVRGGPYDYTSLGGKLYISGTGTAGQPIFIRGAGPNDRPVFAKDVFVKGRYIIFEHLSFDDHGFELRPVLGNLDHIAVRQCEFAGDGLAGGGGTIKVVGNPSMVRDVVFFDNHIHDNGDDSSTAPELGRHGILVSYNTERVWIVDNHIHDNGEDAVQVNFHGNVSPKVPARSVYIGRNVMHGDRENAVDLKICSDVILSENVMYDYQPTATSSGEVVVIHTDQPTPEYPRPDNVWMIGNHIHDANLGVVVTAGRDIYVLGNLIQGIHHAGSNYDPDSIYAGGVGIHARNAGPVHLVHNTVHDCDGAVTASAGVSLWGNILADIAEPQAYHLNVNDGSQLTADHDIYHQSSGSARIRWSGSSMSFGSFQASTGRETHGIEADPLLIGPPGNYQLGAASPAIDAAGPLHAAIATFSNRYGLSIAVDFSGAARVQGTAPDAGAFEQ